MSEKRNLRIEIGICSECQREIYGRLIDPEHPEEGYIIEPCDLCQDDAFDRGYREGYADHAEIEHRQRLERRLFH